MNNLKDISLDIPLKSMVVITGISGSGKTSLVFDALYQSISNNRNIGLESIDGREKIENLILCDQTSIGKSSRSCPLTYLNIYDSIRKLFAKEELSLKNKYDESYFSFNVAKGRCETCKGEGFLKVNMGFLPEMTVVCNDCEGLQFKPDILEVKYKGYSIYDILNLSISKAKEVFSSERNIVKKLEAMERVGLEYLKLGQPTSSLSGGESQRLKLANEIAKTKSINTLLIFDEPTKGLHFEDVKKLLQVMKELVEAGNSLIIVEHNLDMIASSDYIIDIGPGAGIYGGNIVGQGTPLELTKLETKTGIALKEYFDEYKSNI
ncbi:MAG: ATP-binding cassette domain-containing protein [Bacilli bacterium]|nr:ATP-binding cassette domain-containing protein [Bacilli bacterium]